MGRSGELWSDTPTPPATVHCSTPRYKATLRSGCVLRKYFESFKMKRKTKTNQATSRPPHQIIKPANQLTSQLARKPNSQLTSPLVSRFCVPVPIYLHLYPISLHLCVTFMTLPPWVPVPPSLHVPPCVFLSHMCTHRWPQPCTSVAGVTILC